MKASKILQSPLAFCVYIFIYALCIFVLLSYHEPWSEELNGWRIAKDYDIIGMFKLMSHEGHFILWYILAYPFAHLGYPPIFMGVISCTLMLIAGYLWLFKSDFPLVVKLVVLFSYPFVYCFPVIIRCYALIPPILFGIAIIYPQRHERTILYGILLGLMANTHLYMEGFYITMLLLFIYESYKKGKETVYEYKKDLLAVFIAVLGGLVALSQIVGVLFIESSRSVIGSNAISFTYIFSMFMESYFNLATRISFFYLIIYSFLFLCIIYMMYTTLRCEWKYYIILFLPIIYQILFSRFIFAFNFQRIFLPFFILLFVLWIKEKKTKVSMIFLSALVISISFQGSKLVKYDLRSDFGIEHKINDFLSQTKPKNLYVVHDAFLAIDSYNNDIPYIRVDKFDDIMQTPLPDEFSVLLCYWENKTEQDKKMQQIVDMGYNIENVIIRSKNINDAVKYAYHYYYFRKS